MKTVAEGIKDAKRLPKWWGSNIRKEYSVIRNALVEKLNNLRMETCCPSRYHSDMMEVDAIVRMAKSIRRALIEAGEHEMYSSVIGNPEYDKEK